jgi:hypothetical protein
MAERDPLESNFLLKPAVSDEAKEHNERILSDMAAVMDTPHGRRFIWAIMQKSPLYQTLVRRDSSIYILAGQMSVTQEFMTIARSERFLPLFRLMEDEAILNAKAEKSKRENKNG